MPYSPTKASLALQEKKASLRSHFSALRKAKTVEEKKAADDALCRTIATLPCFQNADTVFFYAPLASEPDLLPLAELCLRQGKAVAFPVSHMEDCTLSFHTVSSLNDLSVGAYGIREPARSLPICRGTDRSLCLTPGLAFDQCGTRLGYGKGYYDRFLADFPGISLGVVYHSNLTDRLPCGPHDRKVHMIITEQKVFSRSKKPSPKERSAIQEKGLYRRFIRNKTFTLHPTVLVLTTYILLLLSKLIDIAVINRENRYYSVVILQLMIFLLPAAIWCKFSGENYLSSLRLRMIKLDSLPIILSASFLMASGGLLLGVLFGGTESLSGNFSLYDTFIASDDGTVGNAIYLIMAYAVLPALCEELVYRAILCREYEHGGVLRAILVSSLFFALLHFNVQNFPIYLFAGIILALTFYATRSLFGAILAHFLYNIFGLFGQPYMNNLYLMTGSSTLFLFLAGGIFLLSAAIFCGEAARLYRLYLYKAYSADYRKPILKGTAAIRESYLTVIRQPSAIACFAVYILALLIAWF